MDPLSDVLSLLKVRSYMFGGFDVRGGWSFHFSQHHRGIKCYAMISGGCWLSVEGVGAPVRLERGDCVLLPSGQAFRLASDLGLPSLDAHAFFSGRLNGGVLVSNGGGESFGVGGHFELAGEHASALLAALPPIVHLRKKSDKAVLRWSLRRLMQELREPQPGGYLVAQHLAHIILVEALRLHLAEGFGVGWLFALADKQMSAALTAMHSDPAHRWTLQTLAERAGMSRTNFTQKFKETVGVPPMEYLTRWRMLRAGDRLSHFDDPVGAVSLSVGYESESAFSAAFKRVMGCSPREYGRSRRSVQSLTKLERASV